MGVHQNPCKKCKSNLCRCNVIVRPVINIQPKQDNQLEEFTIRDANLFANFVQPCNGTTVTYFEDFTNDDNRVAITASNSSTLPCIATIIFVTRNGETIERTLPPAFVLPGETFPRTTSLSFQFENLVQVFIRCQGDPTDFCLGSISISKDFCMSCPGKLVPSIDIDGNRGG